MALEPRHPAELERADAPSGLFLSRSGSWFHDGQRVGHRGLEDLLHRSIARNDRGELIVTTGRDVLPFAAEDAPIVVRTLDLGAAPALVLASGAHEPLDGKRFLIDGDGHVRCAVLQNSFWALLSRTASQLLLSAVGDDGAAHVGGAVRVTVPVVEVDVPPSTPAWSTLPRLSPWAHVVSGA